MATIAAGDMKEQLMALRHAVQEGDTVTLTFRGRPYGHVVPADLWERAQAALEAAEKQDEEAAA